MFVKNVLTMFTHKNCTFEKCLCQTFYKTWHISLYTLQYLLLIYSGTIGLETSINFCCIHHIVISAGFDRYLVC